MIVARNIALFIKALVMAKFNERAVLKALQPGLTRVLRHIEDYSESHVNIDTTSLQKSVRTAIDADMKTGYVIAGGVSGINGREFVDYADEQEDINPTLKPGLFSVNPALFF
jgi:hypothetical protein